MKFSIVNTDKKHVVHLSLKPAEWFLERIKTDTKAGDVARMRQYIARFGDNGSYESHHPVAQVFPSVELLKSDDGNLQISAFNGLVALQVDNLLRQEDLQAVKEASRMLPMTFAAFTGADGRSVVILVSVCMSGGTLPSVSDERDLDAFCQSAYDVAYSSYKGVLPYPVTRRHVTSRSSFRMTLDAQPYFNPSATPLCVAVMESLSPHAKDTSSLHVQDSTDLPLYADYERMYMRAVDAAIDETAGVIESQRENAYITELARQLCLMGVPEEEAFLHIRNHHAYRVDYDADTIRSIVEAVYYENSPRESVENLAKVSIETRSLIRFLSTRYVFRYNTIMGYTEYRPNNTWVEEWRPCDEKTVYGLTLEARENNLDVHEKEVRRYVYSNRLRECDPIEDYFWRIRDKWDGKTDHIALLARTVPCEFPQWETWFRKWFLAMVAQWLGRIRGYGNALVPLLISPQGDGKSRFCRQILPPELMWGFYENMQVKEDRATLQAMHNFLLINLDEFNKISPKVQSGFLKNIIQLPSVKIKRPYGKHVEEMSRKASFIAATNEQYALADPTGSRRFITVPLKAPIIFDRQPNYEALYAQAQTLILNGEQYWLTPKEVEELNQHNRQFLQEPVAIQYFLEHYDIAPEENEGQWMSPTAIYENLRHIVGSGLQATGVSAFGRYLRSIQGLKNRRVGRSSQYLVRPKP